MKKIFLTFSAAALLLSFGKAPNIVVADEWDAETLEKANTAKDAAYLSDEEKKVVFYLNLARLKPALFGKTYLQKFIDSTKMKSTSFVLSLKNDLASRFKPVDVLTPKQDLTEEAADHAKDTGKKGNMGNFTSDGKSLDFRMKKFKGVYAGVVENCDYGNKTALAIVIHQLVAEGQGTGQDRRNIMDKNLKYVGVSIQPHSKEKWTCVMDFAK